MPVSRTTSHLWIKTKYVLSIVSILNVTGVEYSSFGRESLNSPCTAHFCKEIMHLLCNICYWNFPFLSVHNIYGNDNDSWVPTVWTAVIRFPACPCTTRMTISPFDICLHSISSHRDSKEQPRLRMSPTPFSNYVTPSSVRPLIWSPHLRKTFTILLPENIIGFKQNLSFTLPWDAFLEENES